MVKKTEIKKIVDETFDMFWEYTIKNNYCFSHSRYRPLKLENGIYLKELNYYRDSQEIVDHYNKDGNLPDYTISPLRDRNLFDGFKNVLKNELYRAPSCMFYITTKSENIVNYYSIFLSSSEELLKTTFDNIKSRRDKKEFFELLLVKTKCSDTTLKNLLKNIDDELFYEFIGFEKRENEKLAAHTFELNPRKVINSFESVPVEIINKIHSMYENLDEQKQKIIYSFYLDNKHNSLISKFNLTKKENHDIKEQLIESLDTAFEEKENEKKFKRVVELSFNKNILTTILKNYNYKIIDKMLAKINGDIKLNLKNQDFKISFYYSNSQVVKLILTVDSNNAISDENFNNIKSIISRMTVRYMSYVLENEIGIDSNNRNTKKMLEIIEDIKLMDREKELKEKFDKADKLNPVKIKTSRGKI